MEVIRLQTLSDIRVVETPQFHPEIAEADRIVAEYCEALGIKLPHFDEYTTMSFYLYPKTTVPRLVAIDILTNLLYYIDDVWDRNTEAGQNLDPIYMRKVFENCLKALVYGIVPDHEHEFYPSCLELHRQFMALSDRKWLERLGRSLIQHLKSTTYSIEDIIKSGEDLVEGYIKLRELDCGMQVTINLIEFGYDMCLPDYALEHPDIKRLTLYTALIGGLVNDMFSYEKEVLRFGSDFNLVSVMMMGRDLPFYEAVHECVNLLNGYIDAFEEESQYLPQWEDEHVNQMVQKYVEGLRDQIIATWHWQISTNRYRSPNSPFPELRQLL